MAQLTAINQKLPYDHPSLETRSGRMLSIQVVLLWCLWRVESEYALPGTLVLLLIITEVQEISSWRQHWNVCLGLLEK